MPTNYRRRSGEYLQMDVVVHPSNASCRFYNEDGLAVGTSSLLQEIQQLLEDASPRWYGSKVPLYTCGSFFAASCSCFWDCLFYGLGLYRSRNQGANLRRDEVLVQRRGVAGNFTTLSFVPNRTQMFIYYD